MVVVKSSLGMHFKRQWGATWSFVSKPWHNSENVSNFKSWTENKLFIFSQGFPLTQTTIYFILYLLPAMPQKNNMLITFYLASQALFTSARLVLWSLPVAEEKENVPPNWFVIRMQVAERLLLFMLYGLEINQEK